MAKDAPYNVSQDLTTSDLTVEVDTDSIYNLIIAAHSDDSETFSVSISWEDRNGNVYQKETATELVMADITDDYSRLREKGDIAVVTLTDTSSAGSNNVNVTFREGG